MQMSMMQKVLKKQGLFRFVLWLLCLEFGVLLVRVGFPSAGLSVLRLGRCSGSAD